MDTMSSALSSSSDFRISLCSFCTSAGMLDFFGSGCFAALGFAAVLAVTLAVLVTLVVTVLADVFFAGTFLAEGFLGGVFLTAAVLTGAFLPAGLLFTAPFAVLAALGLDPPEIGGEHA